jgi:dTDP-4-dehydrorhamnose reductase
MNKKILITGGSGLLGQYLNIELSKENEILTLYQNNPGNCKDFNSSKINITDKESVENIVNTFKPDIVIHTAAISNPRLAASMEPKEVYRTNVEATKNIAELCNQYKAKLIYTSSDLVYAGYRGSMLKEGAKIIPISLYAETKLMGEVKIIETFDNYIILRMALLYGFGFTHSKNHFHQIYKNLKEGKTVKLFYDQFRTPLSLIEASRMLNEICELNLKREIINFGGKERVSRLELGEILCEAAGFNKNLLQKISMDDKPDVPNVIDVSMNTEKLQSYDIKQKSIEESIKEILKDWK